jgi:hypothetical protein
MIKKSNSTTRLPRIPAGLVAFIHETSDNAVRTSKSLQNNAGERYQDTEDKIREFVISLKESRSV